MFHHLSREINPLMLRHVFRRPKDFWAHCSADSRVWGGSARVSSWSCYSSARSPSATSIAARISLTPGIPVRDAVAELYAKVPPCVVANFL